MRVGVIIPYNIDRGWLKDAIKSIDLQTYKGEITSIVSHSDRDTVGHNINVGIDIAIKAKCDIIRYLCEDDMLTANSVRDTVDYFQDNPSIDFLHSNSINFFEGTTRRDLQTPTKNLPNINDMLVKNVIHGGTVAYRARCFDNHIFNTDLWTGEEYEFNMRLMAHGYKLGYMNELTYQYRIHPKQKSIGNKARDYQQKRYIEIEEIKRSIIKLYEQS